MCRKCGTLGFRSWSPTTPVSTTSKFAFDTTNISPVDGLRIDTAQQIDQAFWSGFQSAAGGIHTLGEVFNGDPSYTCPYQQYLYGLLNYPTYYTITQAFQSSSGSISNLANGINQVKSTCQDTTLLGSFLENHGMTNHGYVHNHVLILNVRQPSLS